MNLLQTALEAIEILTTDNSSEAAQATAADARIKLANAMAVEPYGWLAHGLSRLETGKYAEDNARSDARRMGYGAYAFPLYLHPPQQAVTSGERAELIAALRSDFNDDRTDFDNIKDAADMLEADAQQAKPTDCHRSHPHEEMNEVCTLKAEVAQLKAEASTNAQDWSRFHHLMKKHDLHPGRTDDDLLAILDIKLTDAQQAKQVPISDDQIIATFCTMPDFRQYVSAFKAGVKLAEKHHDIGGEA